MIDTLYTPENKIVKSTNIFYERYYYKVRLYSNMYFVAYKTKVYTCYLYDYTEFLRKQMNANASPHYIITSYYCSIDSDEDLFTKHDVSKLTLTRVKEIIDNNFMILNEFNNYVADYSLLQSIEAM